ncbi:MAG: hypothetical protein IKI95_06990, partial [Clostridia bacterium]|nr:hypothetical protein [Clostridia bacterium]
SSLTSNSQAIYGNEKDGAGVKIDEIINNPVSTLNSILIDREIIDEFMYIEKLEHKTDICGNVVGHIWHIIEWTDWQSLSAFLRTGNLTNCKKYIIENNKCLFENYDSYFFRYLHLKGRKKQDFKIEHFPSISSIEDIERFGDVFGLNMPLDFLKSKETEFNEEDAFYCENILEIC